MYIPEGVQKIVLETDSVFSISHLMTNVVTRFMEVKRKQ